MVDTWAPEELRGYAFAIAYRMLGSVGEAEDVVQEAMIRLHATDPAEVRSPTAYTATVTTRLALDELRSARARRERYVGTWLPEPVLGEPDPAERAELRESLTAAFLVVLETLSPVERAVFVLHDLFDLPYAEVADVVEPVRGDLPADRGQGPPARGRAAAAVRPAGERAGRAGPAVLRRARRRRRGRAGEAAGRGRGASTATAAARARRSGTRSSARCGWPGCWPASSGRPGGYGLLLEPAVVNGSPGLRVVDPDGRLVNVLAMDVRDGRGCRIRSIVNPDKLQHLGPVVDRGRAAAGRLEPAAGTRSRPPTCPPRRGRPRRPGRRR